MPKPAANFDDDLAFTEKARVLLEEQLYRQWAYQGRFVSLSGESPGTMFLQRNAHIDVAIQVMQDDRVTCLTIEEKIVRQRHTALAIETHSDKRRDKSGWIYTSTADVLLYAFGLAYGGLEVYTMSLPALRKWFLPVADTFPKANTPNNGADGLFYSECRIVQITKIPVLMRNYMLREGGRPDQRTRFAK
jgi:hypothetical protein